MTISFQTQGGHTYGTLCTVTRVGQKVIKTYGESLGRVVDKERLVFYSRSRGLFQYDPETGSYLPAPPDVEMPKRKSRLKVPAQLVSFVFGDVYLLDRFMDKLGLYPVLESAYKDRLDALKAMVCFYLVSTLSNCYAGQSAGAKHRAPAIPSGPSFKLASLRSLEIPRRSLATAGLFLELPAMVC